MWNLIYFIVIQQLFYFSSNAEALEGQAVVTAGACEFPFIASLQYPNGQHFCSGALITKNLVITAAHCMENETSQSVWIVFGLTKLQNTTIRYAVSEWLTYVEWANRQGIQLTFSTNDADVAIVKLVSEVNQSNVKPIRISNLNKQQIQGKQAIILGWSEDTGVEELQKAMVKILKDDDCTRNMYLITNDLTVFNSRFLCTSSNPYVLLKAGDSGGPLVDNNRKLLGVNFGAGPETKYAWGNFSEEFFNQYQTNLHCNVNYYRDFIHSVMTTFQK